MILPPAFAPYEQVPIWTNWKHTSRKIPLQKGGTYASTKRPETWSTYPVARSRYVPLPAMGGPVPSEPFPMNSLFRGVGFMHSTLTPICTVDIDMKHAHEWSVTEGVQRKKLARELYDGSVLCETSISGKGGHIFGTLDDPELLAIINNGRKFCGFIDVYANHGFLAMTGYWKKSGPMVDLAPTIRKLLELDPGVAIKPHADEGNDLAQSTTLSHECIEELLSHIKHPLGYDDWLSVLLAVKSATGGSSAGMRMVDEWSMLNPEAYAAESDPVSRRWDGLKSSQISVGSLLYIAKAHGANVAEIRLRHHPVEASPAARTMTFKKAGESK